MEELTHVVGVGLSLDDEVEGVTEPQLLELRRLDLIHLVVLQDLELEVVDNLLPQLHVQLREAEYDRVRSLREVVPSTKWFYVEVPPEPPYAPQLLPHLEVIRLEVEHLSRIR
jgi:hypothetical protein